MRYKLTIEYDGTAYHGWQRMPELPTIQETIEHAFYSFTGQHVEVYASGRTDAGVHARGQVAHVDLAPHRFSIFQMTEALHHFLTDSGIAIIDMQEAAPDFHARFQATQRSYRYEILNRRPRPTFLSGYCWHVAQALDAERMHEAAQHLIGTHDITSFRAQGCQAKSPIKTIDNCTVTRSGDMIYIDIVARSFVYNQVRITAGTLMQAGNATIAPSDIPAIIAAKNRKAAGPTAPASGLFFENVCY